MVCAECPPETSTCATILIIDDNHADLRYWSDIVKKFPSNYTVLEASDYKSGLAICRDRTVDCVLLDLDMPESGFRVLLELIPNRRNPEKAVVILTHLVHPTLSEIAKENGAVAYLVKQRTPSEDLDTVIQRALRSVKSTQ